jgi:hypothetical protein
VLLRLLIQSRGTLNFPDFLNVLSPPATGTGPKKKKQEEPAPHPYSEKLTEEQKKQVSDIRELLEALDMRPPEALKKQFEEIVPKDLEPYRKWAPEVGRYSFHWHL